MKKQNPTYEDLLKENKKLQKLLEGKNKLEKQFQFIEEKFSAAAENLELGIYFTDKNGKCTYANPLWCKMTNLTFKQSLNNGWINGIYKEDRLMVSENWNNMVNSNCNRTLEYRLGKKGNISWVFGTAQPVKNEKGEVLLNIVTNINITEQKEFLKEKETERIRFEAMINTTDDLMWSVNKDYKLLAANTAFVKSLREATGWIVKLGDALLNEDYYPVDYLKFWKDLYDKGIAGEALHLEIPVINPQNNILNWFEINIYPINNYNEVTGIACFGRDITKLKLADEELNLSSNHLKETQQIANLGTYTLDIKAEKWKSSELLDNILGINSSYEKTNQSWLNIIHPGWQEIMNQYFLEEVIGKKNNFDKEYQIIRINDKGERWVHGRGHLKFDANNNPILMIGTIQDITERKLMEIELIKAKEEAENSNNKLRSYLANAPDGVFITDESGRYLEANPAATLVTGYSKEELLSMSITDLTPLAEHNATFKHFRILRETGASIDDLKFLHKNGEIRWWSVDAVKLTETRYLGFVKDITERKQKEQHLKLLESVITNTNDSVLITEAEPFGEPGPRIIYVNEAFTKMTGFTADEVIGKTPRILQGPKTDKSELQKMLKAMRNWQACDITVVNYKKNGDEFWNNFAIKPVANDQGWFTHWIAIEKDVTERKNAETALKNAEKRLHFLLSATPAMIYSTRTEFPFGPTFISENIKEQTGYTAEEFLKNPDFWKEHLHADQRQNVIKGLSQLNEKGSYKHEYLFRFKDGSYKWMQDEIRLVYDSSGKPIEMVGYCLNIDERKKAEEQLKESENFFKESQQIANLGAYTMDLITGNWSSSEVFDSIFGIDENFERTAANWPLIVHPDWRVIMNDYFVNEVIGNKSKFDKEYKIVRINDQQERWVHSLGSLKFDENNQPITLVGTARDITQRKLLEIELTKAKLKAEESERNLWIINKEYESINEKLKQTNDELSVAGLDITQRKITEAELKKKSEQLEHANKELEQFVYVASHDLQEPLRKIQTYAGILLDTEVEHITEKGKAYFNRIQTSAFRMQNFINDVLVFSQIDVLDRKFEKINLAPIIDDLKDEFMDVLIEKNATITIDGLEKAKVIPYQFRQLMNNFISNSLKFSKPETPPHIIINNTIELGSDLNNPKLVPDKNYCHIVIKDNGIGFEPKFNALIFEVFRKLHSKDVYDGTGIGLAIVKKIVDNHHGYITAHGELNVGSRFDIYLPED